ncbi:hypothetical protein Dimus_022923 [Dionaea muscipula]
MHIVACKEFYANFTVCLSKKKEVARSKLRGVTIELASMILASILSVPGNNGIYEYMKEGEEVEKEAEIQEGSGSDDKFYDAQVDVEAPADEVPAVPVFPASPTDSTNVQKEPATVGVDPSGPVSSISDSDFAKLQAEFKRACADRIQAELDRAQEENARLLTLLQQAKSQPKS